MDPLIELATLRSVEVDIDGITVKVREFSAFEYTKFQELKETSYEAAGAYLLKTCVLNADGSPRWDDAQAMQVATGASRVVARLINEIHRLSGFGEKH